MSKGVGFKHPDRRSSLVHIVIALLFTGGALALGPGVVWGDTVQYIRIAHELQGAPADEAWESAYREFCEHPSIPYAGTAADCVESSMAGGGPVIGYVDRNPRYQEIFTPRIGYPLLSIPLMNLFGDRTGLWVVAVIATAAAGLLFSGLARLAGLPPLPAVVSQLAFHLLPVSLPHGTALLAEAPTLLASLVMAVGFAHLLRGATRQGAVLMAVGLGLVFFFKYSSTMLLCLSFLVLGLLLLLGKSCRDRRRLRAAAFVPAVLAAGSAAVNIALSLPGLEHSLQDTFTDHFRLPLVTDPLPRLLALEGEFVWLFLQAIPLNVPYVVAFAGGVAGVVIARGNGRLSPAVLAAMALSIYGVLCVVAHPVYSQAGRLGSSLWVGVAMGLGLLAWHLQTKAHKKHGGSRSPGQEPDPGTRKAADVS